MIPQIVWFVVAGGSAVASRLLQNSAKETEQRANDIDRDASKIRSSTIELFDSNRKQFNSYVEQQRRNINDVYSECAEKAVPILEWFSASFEQAAAWPVPADFVEIHELLIPERPFQIHGPDAEYYKVLLGEAADKDFKSALHRGSQVFFAQNQRAIVNHQGLSAMPVAAASMSVLNASLQRHTKAQDALTTATKIYEEAKMLQAQVIEDEKVFKKLRDRADILVYKVTSMKEYFDRYFVRAQILYVTGKKASELHSSHWSHIQNLGRVFVSISNVCGEALV